MNQEQQTPTSNRSALGIVFLVVFIDLLGFGIVLPLLPRIADQFVTPLVRPGTSATGAANLAEGENVLVGAVIGLLMASFSFMQFLVAPVWGQLSDRYGRRPILLIGLAGSVIFYALLGYACMLPTPAQAGLAVALLFVARIGAGAAGATIGTAQAVIADCTPPEKRKHGMAMIGAAFGIGFTFGPLFGYGALHGFPDHLEAIGFTASLLSAVALVLGVWLLPETRRFEQESPHQRRGWNLAPLFAAMTNGAIGPVVLAFFLATLGFAAFEVTLSLFLKDTMKYEEDATFLVFAFIGFMLLLTQGFLYRRLANRLSEVTFMAVGILFMGLGIATLGALSYLSWRNGGEVAGALPWLLVGLTAAVVGFAFLTPSAQALISRRTDAGSQGGVLGVNQSAAAMARIVGPLLALPLYKAEPSHLLPYLFGAVLLLAMLPLIPRIRRG